MRFGPLIPILETVPDLPNRVEIAATPADAIATNRSGPWCWLTAVRGASQPNQAASGVNVIIQEHQIQFGILAMVQQRADLRGGAALEAMATLRDGILHAALGWAPDEYYTPAAHVSDQIAYWADGKLFWLDLFEISHHLRKVP